VLLNEINHPGRGNPPHKIITRNNNLNRAATYKRHKIMAAKAQFEQELNERIQMTVNTMTENKEWREILSHLSQEAKVKIISMVFLSTAVKEGSEQAFVKAVMSLNK
jgi:hypothetical protein